MSQFNKQMLIDTYPCFACNAKIKEPCKTSKGDLHPNVHTVREYLHEAITINGGPYTAEERPIRKRPIDLEIREAANIYVEHVLSKKSEERPEESIETVDIHGGMTAEVMPDTATRLHYNMQTWQRVESQIQSLLFERQELLKLINEDTQLLMDA
jgi:hypothetical protein